MNGGVWRSIQGVELYAHSGGFIDSVWELHGILGYTYEGSSILGGKYRLRPLKQFAIAFLPSLVCDALGYFVLRTLTETPTRRSRVPRAAASSHFTEFSGAVGWGTRDRQVVAGESRETCSHNQSNVNESLPCALAAVRVFFDVSTHASLMSKRCIAMPPVRPRWCHHRSIWLHLAVATVAYFRRPI